MNTPNPHTQLPENLIVVDREWLEELRKEWIDYFERIGYNNGQELELIDTVLKHSTPLTPIIEDSFSKGFCSGKNYDLIKHEERLKDYLSYPIIIKLENDEQNNNV